MKLNLKYPPTPECAPQFARDIVRAAHAVSKVELDYSRASLELVDKIIEGFRQDNLKLEAIGETLFSFGCYVGEVFVKNAGAVWKKTSETPMKPVADMPIVVQLPNGTIANPLGKVFKRFENGEPDSLPYFYYVFAKEKNGESPRLPDGQSAST